MRKLKPTTRFGESLALIILGILFYSLINNIQLVISGCRFMLGLIEPLVIGAILAFLMNVPMGALERLFARIQSRKGKAHPKANSVLALIITYVGTVFLIFLVFYILVPQFAVAVPTVVSAAQESLPRFYAFLQEHDINTANLEALLGRLDIQMVANQVVSNLQKVLSAISSVANVVTLSVTGIIISIYILSNKPRLKSQTRRLLYAYLNKDLVDRLVEVGALTSQTFSNFLSCQCLEALILGVIFFVAMSIFRMPFALVISVVIAFTALIPYVGAVLGCVIGAVLILMVSPNPMQAVMFVVMFEVLQQLEDQLIYPHIVGNSVGLSPLWILVSIFAGGKLFGILGMLFFIPVASVIYSLLRVNVKKQLERKGLRVDADSVTRITRSDQTEDE